MKWSPLLLLISFLAPVFGGFTPQVETVDVCDDFSFIPMGRWDMYFNENQLEGASEMSPIYIRLNLEPTATLGGTLVGIGDTPIYLAIKAVVENDQPGDVRVIADPKSVSIVRWRVGENQIWLKVQTSSAEWLSVDGTPSPLVDGLSVGWTLGISDQASFAENQTLWEQGLANRSSNSRSDLAPISTTGNCTLNGNPDVYVQLTLFSDGAEGVETAEELTQIILGERIPLVFTDGFYAAFRSADCASLVYPWVSYNEQFDSKLVINNLEDTSVNVALTARRGNGDVFNGFITLPARGFIAQRPLELFPDITPGAGFTVHTSASGQNINGRWVTFGMNTPGGQSPSQGTAISPTRQTTDVGEALLFGYLPLGEAFTSAPVVVNLGENPVNVTLYVFNQAGTLLLEDQDRIRDLEPFKPFAIPTTELLPNEMNNLAVIAYAEGGVLGGVGFVFNGSLEPAIGNAQAIPWSPALVTAP